MQDASRAVPGCGRSLNGQSRSHAAWFWAALILVLAGTVVSVAWRDVSELVLYEDVTNAYLRDVGAPPDQLLKSLRSLPLHFGIPDEATSARMLEKRWEWLPGKSVVFVVADVDGNRLDSSRVEALFKTLGEIGEKIR